jgi:nitrile hydratase
MHGFGAVVREQSEPVFHAEWEKSAFATSNLSLAQGIVGSLESYRHAIERMGNLNYLSTSYYEHWLAATELRLPERPLGTEEMSENELAQLVTRDSMIGVAKASAPVAS